MHKLKELYSSPASELLVIRFEESFLQSGGNSSDHGYDDDNDLGEI